MLWECYAYLTVLQGDLSHSRLASLPIRSSSFLSLAFKIKSISFACNVHLHPFLGAL